VHNSLVVSANDNQQRGQYSHPGHGRNFTLDLCSPAPPSVSSLTMSTLVVHCRWQ